MDTIALEGGFTDTPRTASHAFRAVMTAMAHPGRIVEITGAAPPAPLSVAAGTVILTLCDPETPVHLAGACNAAEVRDWIAFHSGAPMAEPGRAMFALGAWDAHDLTAYPVGTSEYPDRSVTVIVEMPDLRSDGARLTGPGIKDTAFLSLPDLDVFRDNAARFPLGLDFLFTCGSRLAALPRTTRVE
ncbi:phosphonate C-P lyase system protein PhnH [Anianabacter salinae]|uniref:phosphonate C-P lyase system protein PhnH n=1 Tax=Anianabacter salinae TaxID=2851023 RepID=UPI00225E48C2|nr:phosphonate C-P lyase system protein PhnH [Anianabacter salinae]MBV0911214.1 phosphonate C-P lyase system protein PhnH [Anianabacter salinae]